MRNNLIKYMRYNKLVEIMYLAQDGTVTKRRIKITAITKETVKAYCFLRRSKRTFKVECILAIVPVIKRERIVV